MPETPSAGPLPSRDQRLLMPDVYASATQTVNKTWSRIPPGARLVPMTVGLLRPQVVP
jgi:hypothetical protein